MNIVIQNRIWTSDLSSSEKMVLLALDNLGDLDGFSWWGYEKLAEMTGISAESKYLTKIINKLEKEGYILVWRQHGRKGGRGYTHIYWLVIGRTDEEITEIVTRRFLATPEEARAIITQSGLLYAVLVENDRISGQKLELTRQKKSVPITPNDNKGCTEYTNDNGKGVLEYPNLEDKNEKGVLDSPRSKESLNRVESNKGGNIPPVSTEISPGPVCQVLLEVCGLDWDFVKDDPKQQGIIKRITRFLANKGAQPGDIREFEIWRKEHHWTGKRGDSSLTLVQVGELWGQYERWVNSGKVNGSQQKVSIGAK